jgi:ribosome recycling factor
MTSNASRRPSPRRSCPREGRSRHLGTSCKRRAHRARVDALVDHIRVDYYGTLTPINQMAAVSTPEPRQIVIKPFDASVLRRSSKAILKSDLGITPQNDGKVLRLTDAAAVGRAALEVRREGEGDVRGGARSRCATPARPEQARGRGAQGRQLTEDENRKLHDKVQELLKDFEKKLDSLQEKKIAEIMEI